MRHCICLLVGLGLMLSITAVAAPPAPSYHLVKRIAVAGDGGWDCLTFDNATRRLYIARSTRVQVVDVERGVLVGEVPNTQGVHGVALVPKLKRGYASNGQDNSVTVFDLATLNETGRISVATQPDAMIHDPASGLILHRPPVASRPDVIIYDPASNRVFTMNGGSNDATAIDVATNKVVGTVALGGKPEFAVADGKGSIFVNIEDKSEIVSFDPKALTVRERWPLGPGSGPSGIAMDVKNRRVFSACDDGMMVVSDADKGKVITTVAIGKGPDGAGFDPKLGLAFSPNGQDGTLTVIKEESKDKFSVLATVPTQTSARTMALDPKTGTIYLAVAEYLPAEPGQTQGRRRQVKPGTFAILVFGP